MTRTEKLYGALVIALLSWVVLSIIFGQRPFPPSKMFDTVVDYSRHHHSVKVVRGFTYDFKNHRKQEQFLILGLGAEEWSIEEECTFTQDVPWTEPNQEVR